MYKKSIFLVSVVLVLFLAAYASAAADATIPSATPTAIDGTKEAAWSVSAEYKCLSLIVDTIPPEDSADLSTSWYALWDPNYLYVFIDINDDDLDNDNPITDESWHDDSVEIMIDIGCERTGPYATDDYQYRVEWGTSELEEYHHGSRSLVGVQLAVSTKNVGQGQNGKGLGYTLEIKFPWSTLNFEGKTIGLGSNVGFLVYVNDNDLTTDRETQLSWIDTSGLGWNEPNRFKVAELVPGLKACSPDPFNGEIGVRSGLLQWTSGVAAASHKVYFDPDQAKVQARAGCQVNGTVRVDPNYLATIAPETTYYWAIDEANAAGLVPPGWAGDVWHFTTALVKASNPDPCNGDQLAAVDADLSWNAGFKSQRHKVYFDTSLAKVQARAGCQINGANTVSLSYALPVLDTSQTYYWAIDEVNDNPLDQWPGDVWQFKTVPMPNLGSILWQLWTNIAGSTVANLTDNPRYPDSPTQEANVPSFEDPAGGEAYGTRMHGWLYIWDTDDYTFWIASNDQSELWLSTDDNPENVQLIASVGDVGTYPAPREWDLYPEQQSDPISLVAGNAYYIMALHKEDYAQDHMSVAWSNTTDPCNAVIIGGRYYLVPFSQTVSFRQSPRDRVTDVRSAPVLTWTPGIYADKHDLYFGTDIDKVRSASRDEPCGVLIQQDITSNPTTTYNIGQLEFDTTYYWRVDDVNAAIDPYFWKGRLWRFTTGSYHAVEDFERYSNTTALKVVWKKNPAAGTTVDINYANDLRCRRTHNDSRHALALKYNNTLSRSEAYADSNGANSLAFGFNWRKMDVKALSLWFHGIPDLRGSYSGAEPYTLKGDGAGIYNTKKTFSTISIGRKLVRPLAWSQRGWTALRTQAPTLWLV